ncbi:hypothetical protein VNO77_07641 [Canavalia gladiata]|uniref:Uncharacterized protein n=1 Tax=Canavalia gladiata TaxID=3824 RepID=A0AAN9R0P2_CANGL
MGSLVAELVLSVQLGGPVNENPLPDIHLIQTRLSSKLMGVPANWLKVSKAWDPDRFLEHLLLSNSPLTSVFRFEPLELTNKKLMNSMNLLVFPCVDIPKHKLGEYQIAAKVANLKRNEMAFERLHNVTSRGPQTSLGKYLLPPRLVGRHLSNLTISYGGLGIRGSYKRVAIEGESSLPETETLPSSKVGTGSMRFIHSLFGDSTMDI